MVAKKSSTRSSQEKTSQSQTREETFNVKGEQLLAKVKEIVSEGNVRRIIIKDKTGKTLVEFPMTLGLIGVVFAPVLAAVGAIAALVSECSITVERNA